jgi:hypothetical protein
MTIDTDRTAVEDLYRITRAAAGISLASRSLTELGTLHRALRLALAEVEAALAPKIVEGARRDMTYVELAAAAGYGSTTTITKIMKEQGASPGRGPKPFRHR